RPASATRAAGDAVARRRSRRWATDSYDLRIARARDLCELQQARRHRRWRDDAGIAGEAEQPEREGIGPSHAEAACGGVARDRFAELHRRLRDAALDAEAHDDVLRLGVAELPGLPRPRVRAELEVAGDAEVHRLRLGVVHLEVANARHAELASRIGVCVAPHEVPMARDEGESVRFHLAVRL